MGTKSELLYIVSQIWMLNPWKRKLYYFIHVHASESTLPILGLQAFEQMSSVQIINFSLSRNKTVEAKKMKCYERLIYKQFVQVSGLSGTQFLSYFPKRPTHLCMEMPYWCTVLVHQYGRRKSTKTSGVHFFYKSSFFPLRTSTRAHKHIFYYLKWLYR